MNAAHKINNWTVVFLVYADLREGGTALINLQNPAQKKEDKITRELKALYNDIVSSSHHQSVDILVIYNRVLLKERRGQHDRTYLLQAVPDPRKPGGKKRLKYIERWDTNNFSKKPEALAEAFEIINRHFSARHCLLFTWDHGSIFGVFREAEEPGSAGYSENIKYEKNNEPLIGDVWLKRNQSYKRGWDDSTANFRQIMSDCRINPGGGNDFPFRDILTNEELSTVITGWRKNKNLDVLIMMNCYMQNATTAYALRNCVDYLVAPQGVINEPGYNYNVLLESIMEDPGIKPKKLAQKAVSSIPDLGYNDVFKKNIDQWAIFATALNEYYLVIDIVNDLSKILSDAMYADPEIKNKIKDIRVRFFPFDWGVSNYMVDLGNCIRKLNRGLNLPALDEIQARYSSFEKKIVVKKFIGINALTPTPRLSSPDNFTPSGVTIFFPQRVKDIIPHVFHTFISESATSRSLFFSNTNWLKFVCEYLS